MRIPLRHYFALLATYLRPQWLRSLLLALLLSLSIGLQLLNPQLLRYFIDTAHTNGVSTILILIALLFIGIALLNQAVTTASTYLSENIAWTATNRLRTDLVAHCLTLDMAFHKAHTPGELIERIDGDVDALSNFFSQFVINLLTNGVMLAIVLVLFFWIHWLIGIAMLIFTLIAMLVLLYLRRRAIPLWKEQRQQSANLYSFLSERLTGTEDIRANGATDYIMQRFLQLVRQLMSVWRKAMLTANLMGVITLAMFIFCSTLGLGIGAYLFSINTITLGTVYLIFNYTTLISQPIQQIQTQLQDLQQAEACIQRIEELLRTSSKLQDGSTSPLTQGALAVDFQHVSFGYDENTTVLHDLSFHLTPGRVLGILGRTGSGKTTLAHLLFRLYDPQSGNICLNDHNIQTMRLRHLRLHIGMVTQDVQLFHATIRDNLTFFNHAIPDEQILSILASIGLATWYSKLAKGLDTMLNANGGGLSAGEAQLLAFTRVFLTYPGLVILDEASSRLDPATEHLIEQAIHKLFEGRTAIVIAHRLATIQQVDDILILEDGHILEYGQRTELASNPSSRFSQLMKTGLEEVHA